MQVQFTSRIKNSQYQQIFLLRFFRWNLTKYFVIDAIQLVQSTSSSLRWCWAFSGQTSATKLMTSFSGSHAFLPDITTIMRQSMRENSRSASVRRSLLWQPAARMMQLKAATRHQFISLWSDTNVQNTLNLLSRVFAGTCAHPLTSHSLPGGLSHAK